jgi:site-specific DNA recombinase
MSKNELELFQTFGKGRTKQAADTRNCVIYTRVSTKEQADNNMSLETQKKACELYAKKSGYQITGCFGGTYESAKTDERKHFNAMLAFVKKSKERISHIIVYSVDRFSRSGANAIYIAEKLKKEGVSVFAISQPTDSTTASGSLQQNIQFIFSEYDNQLRREKCMAGVREKIQQGIWCTAPPMGYDIVWANGKKEINVNSVGKLLRKGFYWKAEGLSNEEVRSKLGEHGLKISNQRVSEYLRNPFYCGLLVHTALEGKVIEGIQEKVISKEIFLQVNGILAKNHQGYRIKKDNDDIPLKRFIKCEACGSYLRGYKAYKNQKYYYKCNTVGCKNNKRADCLHEAIKGWLEKYTVDINEDYHKLIKAQITATYNQLNKDKEELKISLEKQLAEVDKKIERLDERYILEEIDKAMFEKFKSKFIAERTEICKSIAKNVKKVSNLETLIDNAIVMASKLASLWDSNDYADKQTLQDLVFPAGMTYCRKTNECRTPRVNSILGCIKDVASVSANNKSGDNTLSSDVPAFVASPGIEPGSGASETHILSIVLRGHAIFQDCKGIFFLNRFAHTFTSPPLSHCSPSAPPLSLSPVYLPGT